MARMKAWIAVGLGYGDEGKGATVDYLVRAHQASAVVRFSGGPQAAHYVVDETGRTHCFSQFGSGMLVPGVSTHLSRYVLVKPQNLAAEAEALARNGVADACRRLSIDPRCTLVTPYHAMLGQLRELARASKVGTVGMGVGQAVLDRENGAGLQVSDLLDGMEAKLRAHREARLEQARPLLLTPEARLVFERFAHDSVLEEMLRTCRHFVHGSGIRFLSDDAFLDQHDTLIFEGSQGALIDYDYGFWPYVTKTDVTVRPAEALLAGRDACIRRVGVLRAYAYRHGPGPMVSEAGLGFAEMHNQTNPWQGKVRTGWFDLVATRYAAAVNGGVDELALTHVDRAEDVSPLPVCVAYEGDGGRITQLAPVQNGRTTARTEQLMQCRPVFEELRNVAHLMQILGTEIAPVGLVSRGPTARDRQPQ